MIATNISGFGAAGGPIRAIQNDLRTIGIPLRATGTLDDATVLALNQVFVGSVDVPRALATGTLTKHDIAAKLPVVMRSLKVIVHGAQNLQNVNDG